MTKFEGTAQSTDASSIESHNLQSNTKSSIEG